MEKKRNTLVPQYMHEFSCIGPACEDSCCVGWRVGIDKSTYKKYKKSNDKELKQLFEENVKRNRLDPSDTRYATLKMDNKNRCSFLSEENLCKIQLNLGENMLSNTCAVYPRRFNRVNGVFEKSLTMSCPEAARLALLNPNGIEFDQIEESPNTHGFITYDVDTNNPQLINKPAKYFWELRTFTIQVLQERTYSLDERLILLGLFYQNTEKKVKVGKVDAIPIIISEYRNMIKNGEAKGSLSTIPTQLAIQMKVCKELLDYRVEQGISSQRYVRCLLETLQGINYTNESNVKEVTDRYKEVYEEYYKPFMADKEYILENYLVNYVFRNLFPLKQKNLFEDFVMLIVHYSMIKLHLIGMSGYHKGLTTDLIISLIQSFSKVIEHSHIYLKRVFDILKENGFTTMAYMAILIKN
ncbi:flagellin lysine-N-methylase [Neobacillus niacini]|uniref:flagellin lysine-N-methylase n=1 Tax=Neobacillus niacini TaxID=86668 RepID=UPI00285624BE|nr:flagellin lysine-N-methylase [Neobacillus niacini]MDR7000998.1 lysine-N-methylase [Neobacillus niacini]